MKTAIQLFAANITTMGCVAGAIYLRMNDKDGFGWLLLCALILAHTLGTREETE